MQGNVLDVLEDGNVVTLLDGVSATGASESVIMTPGMKNFQIVISNTATVAIQASNDGTNWETLTTATSSGMYDYSGSARNYRANVTAYTSGTVTVIASA